MTKTVRKVSKMKHRGLGTDELERTEWYWKQKRMKKSEGGKDEEGKKEEEEKERGG